MEHGGGDAPDGQKHPAGAGLVITFTLMPLKLCRAARPRSYAVCVPRSKAGRIFLKIPGDFDFDSSRCSGCRLGARAVDNAF